MLEDTLYKGDVIETHMEEPGWRKVVALEYSAAGNIRCVKSRDILDPNQELCTFSRLMLDRVVGPASEENMATINQICTKHGIGAVQDRFFRGEIATVFISDDEPRATLRVVADTVPADKEVLMAREGLPEVTIVSASQILSVDDMVSDAGELDALEELEQNYRDRVETFVSAA